MAKKMSWTDPSTGYTYPDLIWLPIGFNNDVSRRANKTDILGYINPAAATKVLAYALGLSQEAPPNPITSVSYTPTPEEFATMALVDYPGANFFERTAEACYALAASSAQNRWKDGETMRPFFYTAVDVALSLTPPQAKAPKKKEKVKK